MKTINISISIIVVVIILLVGTYNTISTSKILTNGISKITEVNHEISTTKRMGYSNTISRILTSSSAPAGFTLVSSSTRYLFDDIGSGLQNVDFQNFAVQFSSSCNLGTKSYVEITSILDGHSQQLNSETLSQWRNISAFLNGEYGKIDVYQHDTESGISCPVERLITTTISHTQQHQNPQCTGTSLCGNSATDDLARIPSIHPAVARKIGGIPNVNDPSFIGGSGNPEDGFHSGGSVWIASNGSIVSAGHVLDISERFMQISFNNPASTANGAIQLPSPDHQYAVDYSSFISNETTSSGGDWAVFNVYPNPNTGVLPQEVQESFYRVGNANIPSTGTKFGYGIDVYPSGPCGSLNSANRTLQQTNISSVTMNGTGFTYVGVNEGGDSGGPVTTLINSIEVVIGPNAYCFGSTYSGGTNFLNTNFADALNELPGSTTEYIDSYHPSTLQNGSIFSPYKTIVDGISGATNGDQLSIVEGDYDEALTISKPLTLIAPVGKVTIGASGTAKANGIVADNDSNSEGESDTPLQLELSQNYPNPFNPTTTINYQVPDAAKISLKIYNSLGREVVTLVSESKQPGSYSVNFDASELASGVYFYVLRTGDKELVKQMTLIK